MVRSRRLVGFILLATMTFAFGAQAEPRTETRRYVANLTGLSSCTYLVEEQPSNGGHCFFLDGDESQAAISVLDDLGKPVGAYVTFYPPPGDGLYWYPLSHYMICAWPFSVEVPRGAAVLRVTVYGLEHDFLWCSREHESVPIRTPAGTITVTFS